MSTQKDPNNLSADDPGAKLDAGKYPAWGKIRPVWQLIRHEYINSRVFGEADMFFTLDTNPKNVYDVQFDDLRSVLNSVHGLVKQIADVGEFGARKYTVGGFMHVEKGSLRYLDAAARHYLAFLCKEDNDEESGMCHLWHARWNIAAAARLIELKYEADDA